MNPGAPEASEDVMARMGTVIGQSQTADNMTVTLHAAVWDGETLRLSMTAEKPDMPEEWNEALWRGSWIYWEECRFSMRRDQLEDYTRKEVESRYAEMDPEKLEQMAREQLAGDLFTLQQSFRLIRREGDKLFFEATLPLADYVERPELTLHIEKLATYEEGKGAAVTSGDGERAGPGPDVVFLNGPYDFTFTLDKKLQPVIYEGAVTLTAENIPLEVSRIKLTASAVEMWTDYFNVHVGWSEEQNSVVLGVPSRGEAGTKGPNPTKPAIGATVGPYKEVAAKTVDTKQQPSLIADDKTHVQTVTGIHISDSFIPENGRYVVLKLTNNGKGRITCLAGQPAMLGEPAYFPAVDVEPGHTLTRAFELDGGTPMEKNDILFDIRGAAGSSEAVDVTFSVMQFK